MTVAAPCVHRWRIDEPNGPLAQGICSQCGARREFRTAPKDYSLYEIESLRRGKSGRSHMRGWGE